MGGYQREISKIPQVTGISGCFMAPGDKGTPKGFIAPPPSWNRAIKSGEGSGPQVLIVNSLPVKVNVCQS